ncbi:MAG: D-glycero-beta-D-manno-heptose-7-phosphate kinase [Chitinispirillales bacterium]|nr:D-glycero-beta-D-manno-heptose-7-phosphate kinase [Chitinispirillales bacterium]
MEKLSLGRAKEIISSIKGRKILVVGDAMLDKYVWGSVYRISPEAPVPVVNMKSETFRLGGAANVLQNVAALGADPFLGTVYGNDENGKILCKTLKNAKCEISALVLSESRPTTTKTRIMAHNQQVVRVDKETDKFLEETDAKRLNEKLTEIIPQMSAVIISDYGKGVLCKEVLSNIFEICKKNRIFTAVDPKQKDFSCYSETNVITPNYKEVCEALGERFCGIPLKCDEIVALGRNLMQKYNLKNLLLTLSERGMMLFENDKYIHLKTAAKDVFDVTGAGDSVISAFTASVAAGANLFEAAFIANCAAGISVAQTGTASVKPKELITYISNYIEK